MVLPLERLVVVHPLADAVEKPGLVAAVALKRFAVELAAKLAYAGDGGGNGCRASSGTLNKARGCPAV